jgi:gephyrin
MVVEARNLSDGLTDVEHSKEIKQALDAMGYDEAAQYIYGMDYGEWKRRHMKDVSDDQMKRFNESQPIQAQHDKQLLEPRSAKPFVSELSQPLGLVEKNASAPGVSSSVLSDVCCQDVEEVVARQKSIATASQVSEPDLPSRTARSAPTFKSPPPPAGGITFALAVLTVSDRASANLYESGDLSGPAVVQSVQSTVERLNTLESPVACNIVAKSTVPDVLERIQEQLKVWCGNSGTASEKIDLILTTGGTGFAPRDVTPEATRGILERECLGLLSFVATECSTMQPLASLSRGTAGLRGNTFIVNLPGNPKGVEQIMPILLPILIHAIFDLQKS